MLKIGEQLRWGVGNGGIGESSGRFLDFESLGGGILTFRRSEPLTNIEIHDAAVEARMHRQMQAMGAATAEEALLRLLHTQEEQDRWLHENRDSINAKIALGIAQLERGEGIPEDRLESYLAALKEKPE